MLQQDNPDDYVIATGQTHTVRQFVGIAAQEFGYSLVWKGKGLDEKGIDKKSGKDRRKLKNFFGTPVSREDFCYMYAWNKFIVVAMQSFPTQGKKGLYYLTKDITKFEFNEKETTKKLDEYDFIAMVLVEDEDKLGLFGFPNAIIEYYQKLFPSAKAREYKGLI